MTDIKTFSTTEHWENANKIILRFYLTSVRKVIIQKLNKTKRAINTGKEIGVGGGALTQCCWEYKLV